MCSLDMVNKKIKIIVHSSNIGSKIALEENQTNNRKILLVHLIFEIDILKA